MAEARVLAVLARHEASLMRVARQWSLCQDDALDAFQRGLEIYVRKLDSVDRATEAAWLRVVIRHEALAIRRARSESVADADFDVDTAVAATERSVEEQILSGDRVSRSADALRALKPDEARALMLKAHGLSYEEIGRRCGWTYTKVNRAITEGRRRFLEVYGALEAGEECDRFGPILQALAAGTASSEQLVEARPHLRRCPACRATVRDLHLSRLRKLRLLLPLPALGLPLRWLRERLVGGGAPPESDVHLTPMQPPELPDPTVPPADPVPVTDFLHRFKHQATSLLHRTNSSDLAAGIHIATTTGGGRIATLGALIGMCLSGVGAGTVCVVTGLLEDPFGIVEHHPRPAQTHRAPPAARQHASSHAPTPIAAELLSVRATPTPTPKNLSG
jgi:RNA polymerase sigma factor (sigma-70 family)